MLKILLAVDGSPASMAAVHHAVRLLREGLAASFVLANVQEPATLYELVTAHDPQVLEQVSAGAGAHALEAAAAALVAAGASFEEEVAQGDPAQVLAELIERHGVDGVVMGARGLGSARSVLTGSVSHWLLSHASVPVTVVKAPEAG